MACAYMELAGGPESVGSSAAESIALGGRADRSDGVLSPSRERLPRGTADPMLERVTAEFDERAEGIRRAQEDRNSASVERVDRSRSRNRSTAV